MALGGGVFVTQNKILPGSYINFVSASRASATLSERGYAAMPLSLDWGVAGEIFTVDNGQFQKDSMKIFGYDYTHEKMRGLRDLFRNLKTGYFYKINDGGVKARNNIATALHAGSRGNDIRIVVEPNERMTEQLAVYDVLTYLDGLKVDSQTVKLSTELKSNSYVEFSSAELAVTAGIPLDGGANGAVTNANYQVFLDKIESYSFNTLGCLSNEIVVKSLFAEFTKRMRNDVGVKFQCVLHKHNGVDFEGVISVENNDTTDLVYWVTGAEAGCAVNRSNTNKEYDGEFNVNVNLTQRQLEDGIRTGKFMLHRVDDKVRVLEDINTFVSFTDEKNEDFNSNQTMRILDQIANDIALLFNTRYLGKVPNDAAGRITLWNDIVKHHQELQSIRAIENLEPDKIKVEKGQTKKSVVVTDYVTPVNAMAQLYMTVMVS